MTEAEILAILNRLRREMPDSERDRDAMFRTANGWYRRGFTDALLALRREILRARRDEQEADHA